MRLQSAIFDMDGTLLDTMPMWRNLLNDYLRSQGRMAKGNLWEEIRPLTLLDTAVYLREVYKLNLSEERIVAEIEQRIQAFYQTKAQAKPGVEKFLSLLKMEGVWMYVATGTDRPLAQAGLKCAGLDEYFRGIITCQESGAGKDKSADIFERAMVRLRSNKRDTIIFEDSLPAIRTAKAAGFRVAGVYDADAEAEQDEIRAISDYYIRSFEEMFAAQAL
ncbi:MAG: HAD family phosphatase [Oscillibacter sp.]|nr:HAD family phosphatase [Oscillibacter sp.]